MSNVDDQIYELQRLQLAVREIARHLEETASRPPDRSCPSGAFDLAEVLQARTVNFRVENFAAAIAKNRL